MKPGSMIFALGTLLAIGLCSGTARADLAVCGQPFGINGCVVVAPADPKVQTRPTAFGFCHASIGPSVAEAVANSADPNIQTAYNEPTGLETVAVGKNWHMGGGTLLDRQACHITVRIRGAIRISGTNQIVSYNYSKAYHIYAKKASGGGWVTGSVSGRSE